MENKSKSIWNCHILDKLYFIHVNKHVIDEEPITSIAIENRDIYINFYHNIDDYTLRDKNSTRYYLNKEDADKALVEHDLKHSL